MAEIGTDIVKASEILNEGGLVSIPTETVYGLAANAINGQAVAKIFEAKKRPSFDPLIVHIPPTQDGMEYVHEIPESGRVLMDFFWPGPLTFILRKKSIIPDLVTSGLDTVGIRMPRHPLTQDLLEKVSFPLSAPSANLFGSVSPTTPQHVEEQLGDRIDYILDGGDCAVGLESTIIGWEEEKPTIYRLGGITQEEIEHHIGEVQLVTHSSSNPTAPGMLTSHYAPKVKMILGELPEEKIENVRSGRLRFQQFDPRISKERQLVLSPGGDMNQAARNLFSVIRKFDTMHLEEVYVDLAPEEGLGRAINDRLRRAAAR